jgi:hypothetical protein
MGKDINFIIYISIILLILNFIVLKVIKDKNLIINSIIYLLDILFIIILNKNMYKSN